MTDSNGERESFGNVFAARDWALLWREKSRGDVERMGTNDAGVGARLCNRKRSVCVYRLLRVV